MIYAISDLHGCYDKYLKMLEKINFSESDTLYILGDIVDRGPDGIKILLDIYNRKNVIALRGNHDYLAHYLLYQLNPVLDMGDDEMLAQKYHSWLCDGGEPTYNSYEALSFDDKKKVLASMYYMPIYEEIEVNGNKFFLSHTVPSKERMQDFNKLLWQEFIAGEPEYEKRGDFLFDTITDVFMSIIGTAILLICFNTLFVSVFNTIFVKKLISYTSLVIFCVFVIGGLFFGKQNEEPFYIGFLIFLLLFGFVILIYILKNFIKSINESIEIQETEKQCRGC